MSKDYMYRAQILDYPEFEEYEAFDSSGRYGEGTTREMWHRPVGWVASEDYVERYDSDKFFEPSTSKWYKSRSSASDRVKLLASMGYTAIVQRSAPIIWPAGDAERVDDSAGREIQTAIRTLLAAGVIKSADELFR